MRRASLRPIGRHDIDWLWDLLSHPDVLPYWRFRGVMPGPDRFQEALWAGVQDQRIITNSSGDRFGLVTAYGTEIRAGHTHIAVAFDPESSANMWAMEGVIAFIEHLFETFPLRKIYIEITERRLQLLSRENGFPSAFQLEGVLRDFIYEQGGLTDLYLYALSRESFTAALQRGPVGA